jgi:PAS domain S-box-containing protein
LGLIENTDEIIYTQDLQGNYTSINRIGEQLTGYTREEILSMSFQEIVAPECVDLVWLNILRMLEDRRPTCYEVVIVTRDCQRIPLGVTHHLIYREGTPIGIQGVARDLTWRIPKLVEETERRFGNNFEH